MNDIVARTDVVKVPGKPGPVHVLSDINPRFQQFIAGGQALVQELRMIFGEGVTVEFDPNSSPEDFTQFIVDFHDPRLAQFVAEAWRELRPSVSKELFEQTIHAGVSHMSITGDSHVILKLGDNPGATLEVLHQILETLKKQGGPVNRINGPAEPATLFMDKPLQIE